jgi:hypothetical protein|tara:strand:- start:267 stop:1019 length:753 start_codon:yes stop_codon:yes gene_type:complete
MSVRIDTVYQRVLGIINKEQRGFVTPQEFNLFANQAQLEIFEQYFYDINQHGRLHGNDTEYSDMLNILNEKINLFETQEKLEYVDFVFKHPNDLYRLGTVIYNNVTTKLILDYINGPKTPQTTTEFIEVERINQNEFLYINSSPLTKPKNVRPVFTADNKGIKVYGDSTIVDNVSLNYIKYPAKVEWRYQMVYGEALYDAAISTDFELHGSEETDLVIKILALAGMVTKEDNVVAQANAEDAKNTQQEKQ